MLLFLSTISQRHRQNGCTTAYGHSRFLPILRLHADDLGRHAQFLPSIAGAAAWSPLLHTGQNSTASNRRKYRARQRAAAYFSRSTSIEVGATTVVAALKSARRNPARFH